jgi:hypothetical protein
MKQVTLDNASEFLANNGLKISPVYPLGKYNHWRVLDKLEIVLSNDKVITINKGFEFDGSSTPRGLWWIFPSYGNFFLAALIHDYMYKNEYLRDEIGISPARLLADKEMLLWSKALNSQTWGKKLDNNIRYAAVRLFGKSVYLE